MFTDYRHKATLLTFIGIVAHEAAHVVICLLFDLDIEEIVWFDPDIPGGYVKHRLPAAFTPALLVATAPLLFNTAIAVSLTHYLIRAWIHGPTGHNLWALIPGSVIGLWLIVSTLYHSFPSRQDARALWRHSLQLPKARLIYLFIIPPIMPFIGFLLVLDLSRQAGGDIVYTIGIISITAYLSINPTAGIYLLEQMLKFLPSIPNSIRL